MNSKSHLFSDRPRHPQSPSLGIFIGCLVAVVTLSIGFSGFADTPVRASEAEKEATDEWAAQSKTLAAMFIEVPDFKEYPEDKQEACQGLPNLITHGFMSYGVDRKTGKAYTGRVEFRRASDDYHLLVKRNVGDRVEWGVARFVYTIGGTDPGQEYALRKLIVRWKSGGGEHTIRYEHIHRLNFDPESKFVGVGETFHETLIMDSL